MHLCDWRLVRCLLHRRAHARDRALCLAELRFSLVPESKVVALVHPSSRHTGPALPELPDPRLEFLRDSNFDENMEPAPPEMRCEMLGRVRDPLFEASRTMPPVTVDMGRCIRGEHGSTIVFGVEFGTQTSPDQLCDHTGPHWHLVEPRD